LRIPAAAFTEDRIRRVPVRFAVEPIDGLVSEPVQGPAGRVP
jgi:hypothetical protein